MSKKRKQRTESQQLAADTNGDTSMQLSPEDQVKLQKRELKREAARNQRLTKQNDGLRKAHQVLRHEIKQDVKQALQDVLASMQMAAAPPVDGLQPLVEQPVQLAAPPVDGLQSHVEQPAQPPPDIQQPEDSERKGEANDASLVSLVQHSAMRSAAAFSLFVEKSLPGLLQQNPGVDKNQLPKMVEHAWKQLAPEDKEPFFMEAPPAAVRPQGAGEKVRKRKKKYPTTEATGTISIQTRSIGLMAILGNKKDLLVNLSDVQGKVDVKVHVLKCYAPSNNQDAKEAPSATKLILADDMYIVCQQKAPGKMNAKLTKLFGTVDNRALWIRTSSGQRIQDWIGRQGLDRFLQSFSSDQIPQETRDWLVSIL